MFGNFKNCSRSSKIVQNEKSSCLQNFLTNSTNVHFFQKNQEFFKIIFPFLKNCSGFQNIFLVSNFVHKWRNCSRFQEMFAIVLLQRRPVATEKIGRYSVAWGKHISLQSKPKSRTVVLLVGRPGRAPMCVCPATYRRERHMRSLELDWALPSWRGCSTIQASSLRERIQCTGPIGVPDALVISEPFDMNLRDESRLEDRLVKHLHDRSILCWNQPALYPFLSDHFFDVGFSPIIEFFLSNINMVIYVDSYVRIQFFFDQQFCFNNMF